MKSRADWVRQNLYYYEDLKNFYRFHTERKKIVLEIGAGTGLLMRACEAKHGFGLELSDEYLAESKEMYPEYQYANWTGAEALPQALIEAFPDGVDYIFLVNALGVVDNIQETMELLKPICRARTRIISNYINFLWAPIFSIAEMLDLKMPQLRKNWLAMEDVKNILQISGFREIKTGYRFLFPKNLGILSVLLNQIIVRIFPFSRLGCTQFFIARMQATQERKDILVSIVIPARNEKGNIAPLLDRVSKLVQNSHGEKYEVIFVEGNSKDDTAKEISFLIQSTESSRGFPAYFYQQSGIGKGDAVRLGFSKANGDLLVILDADLTVAPEEIPRFVGVYCDGHGEFFNGSRLVYAMEKEAMMPLNLLGNKFFSLAFTWLLGQNFKDTLCGTKMLSRENYQRVIAGRSYFGDFDPFGDFDLIFGASKLDLEITEIPIRYYQRKYGQTNISRWKHGWLLLRMSVYAMGRIKFVP